MKQLLKHGVMAMALLATGQFAHAGTLNLTNSFNPDIQVSNLDISNTPSGSNDTFSVTNAGDYFPPGYDLAVLYSPAFISGDYLDVMYTLHATIDINTGELEGSNNTVSIFGWSADGYDGSPTPEVDAPTFLLQGTLTGVGFNSNSPGATSGNEVSFTFTPTNGVFQNLFAAGGGINFSFGAGQATDSLGDPVTPSFSQEFTADDTGVTVDNFAVVPTPAALYSGSLLLSALGALAVRRRVSK